MPANEGGALDLEAVADQVVRILVDSFGYSELEVRHRLNLVRAQQHDLQGKALECILPGMTREDREHALLKWALESWSLEADLRSGAAELGITLDHAD